MAVVAQNETKKDKKMKSTIISMFIVLIVLMIVPVFMFSDGDLLEKFGFGGGSGSVSDSVENLKAKAPKNLQNVTTDKKVEVYKWVDEHGVMQFSSTPPVDGGNSEKMVLSPNANVVDAVKIPAKEPEVESKSQVVNLSSPYSPSGMKDMIENTMKIQEQMNSQRADQDKMLQKMIKK